MNFRKEWQPEVEAINVTDKDIVTRFDQWLQQAKQHEGDPVLTYEVPVSGLQSIHMGVVRQFESDLEPEPFIGIKLAKDPTVTINSGSIKGSLSQMRIGHMEAYQSFQRYKPYIFCNEEEVADRFQLVFGNEAIANWFSRGVHPTVEPYRYVQMARKLELEPIITPEIDASVSKAKGNLVAYILQKALMQASLSRRIEAVYDSIDRGVAREGLTIRFAPESRGEANLMTYQHRSEIDKNDRVIQELKQELIYLGIDAADFYKSIASLLGLEFSLDQPN